MAITSVTIPNSRSVTKPALFVLSFLNSSSHILAIDTFNKEREAVDVTSIHGLVCIGRGADSTAVGIIASVIILLVISFFLWLSFAYIRPKFRELYGVREWFPPPENRSTPVYKSLRAFFLPHLLTQDNEFKSKDVHSKSDTMQFPSDGQLAHRTLSQTFMVVCFSTIVGLGGGLPLYLIRTPCVAHVLQNDSLGGRFSAVQDLSIFRLLTLQDNHISTRPTIQTRLIILAILVVIVVVIPSILKFLSEFSRIVVHRRQWLDVKCGGIEMAWLSSTNARGFTGWGENTLKNHLVKIGLSQGFKANDGKSNALTSTLGLDGNINDGKGDVDSEIDIHNLFSIVDISHLAQLVQERDIILNNLEVAEIQYINSFQLSTPIPSITDYEAPAAPPPTEVSELKHRISRPKALRGSIRLRTPNQRHTHVIGSTPTAYLAPSSFYRLRDIRISQISSQSNDDNLASRISQRVIGTRFQEVHRGSRVLSRIFSWGSGSRPENLAGIGSMNPAQFSTEQLRHGPNEPLSGNVADNEVVLQDGFSAERELDPVTEETQGDLSNGSQYFSPSIRTDSSEFNSRPRPRPRPRPQQAQDRRSTFAMRLRPSYFSSNADPIPPPHLRLQSQRPFVRPLSGMDHDQLGAIYNNIREWRSRLKVINMETSGVQQSCYDSIANGNKIKGWILVGRGLRHLPNVQMIEGRSKEDVLYDLLQINIGGSGKIIFWSTICMITMLSCGAMIPVTGLVVSLGPGVTHYLRLFNHLNKISTVGAGLASTLAPALFILLLIGAILPIIQFTAHATGTVSASVAYIRGFRATFMFLNATFGFWLVACGSVLFSLESFATGSHRTEAVTDGLLYFISFLIVLTLSLAAIFPTLWLIQPIRLVQMLRRRKFTVTPRQRFRNLYPDGYDRNFVLACCYLPVTFAATFSIIFPIIGVPVCLLLIVALIAHKYLISYVFIEPPQTGGLLQLWLLPRLASLMTLQPLVLGLIILTRRFWVIGGILVGISVLLFFCISVFTWFKLRSARSNVLSEATQDVLHNFRRTAHGEVALSYTEGSFTPNMPPRPPRSSVASVLEMMSISLAVIPAGMQRRGPIPLPSEIIDDLTATETAARTNPDAPPRLPPLPFMTHTEEMYGILYPPELLAPPPVIWLPNDSSGVAETEAIDLFRYHDLQTTLDIGASESIQQMPLYLP